MNKYVAEALGTFILIFAGTGAIVINDVTGGAVSHVGIALTFGLVVMAMIYAIGDISGAHINPAVTIAFWIANRFEGRSVIPYIASQLLGAVAASGVVWLLFFDDPQRNIHHLGSTLPAGVWWQSFILEFILTFILMFVILNVSAGAKEKGITAALAIGGVVCFEAMFAGPICGASMNPARSFGPAIVSGHLTHLWIYLLAPTAGAIAAVFAYRCVQGEECCSTGDEAE